VQRYPVRPAARANLNLPALEAICRDHLGSATRDEKAVHAAWGAVTRFATWPEAKELVVDLATNPQVPPEVAAETVQRYNRFLEAATGYSAKERAKRLRKSAGGD